jgi:hypothetical protein
MSATLATDDYWNEIGIIVLGRARGILVAAGGLKDILQRKARLDRRGWDRRSSRQLPLVGGKR